MKTNVSKTITDATLLHDLVRRMPGFYFSVNGYVRTRDRAVPDIMVAFAVTNKLATVGL